MEHLQLRYLFMSSTLPKSGLLRIMSLNYKTFFKENDEERVYWNTGLGAAGCIFIAKDTGRILLPHRSDYCNEPNTWGTWGGKIDHGESPIQAVEREVEEETGFSGKYKVSHLYTFEDPDANFKYYNYLTIVPHEFYPELNWENDKAKWVEFGEWPHPLHFGLEALLTHAGDKIKKVVTAIKKRNAELIEAVDVPPSVVQQESEFSSVLIDFVKSVENSIHKGFRNGKWYPHASVEGGAPTIAYGHKLKPGEISRLSQGITDKEAKELLINDLRIAKDVVINTHSKWVKSYVDKAHAYASARPNDPKAKFFAGIKITDPMFHLSKKQLEALIDYAFNLGSLKGFPKFSDAIFRQDWDEAKKQYKRTYVDTKGKRHPLGRNEPYYNTFLKESANSIRIVNKGLIDDGVNGYEMMNEYSVLRFGYEPAARIFYLTSIATEKEQQKKGYAKSLLESFFQYIKNHHAALDPGSYTSSGEAYIRPLVERFSKQYGVRLVEGDKLK